MVREFAIQWGAGKDRWVFHNLNRYPYSVRIYTTEAELENGLRQLQLRHKKVRVVYRDVPDWEEIDNDY